MDFLALGQKYGWAVALVVVAIQAAAPLLRKVMPQYFTNQKLREAGEQKLQEMRLAIEKTLQDRYVVAFEVTNKNQADTNTILNKLVDSQSRIEGKIDAMADAGAAYQLRGDAAIRQIYKQSGIMGINHKKLKGK